MRYLFFIIIGITAAARADAPFFEFDGPSGFYGSPGVPDEAVKLLKKAAESPPLKCFAYTPGGADWIFLFSGSGYYTSNLSLPVCKKLDELQKQNADLKCVAFAPGGGWTVLWNQNGSWTKGSVPDDAYKKIVEVGKSGGTLRSVAYGPCGAWVVLFDKSGLWYGGVPAGLAKVLDNAVKKDLSVRCVDFSGDDWICLADHEWWTSNVQLAAAKRIAENVKQGNSPKWIAMKPAFARHDFARWAEVYHKAFDGKLAGGYAFEVLDHGKVVVQGAEGWARAPREKESPGVKWTLDKPQGVASVSKTVSTVALLKLWEETDHRFSLDDPFWPYIRAVCPTAHDDVKSVTIRQLLMHRSGFKPGEDCTNPKKLQKLLDAPLEHKPGTHYKYHNDNFYIIHLLIEQIGHVHYTQYVKAHVLKPMGITGMETHSQPDAPTCGYKTPDDNRPGYPFAWKCESWAGAAGWYASVSDLGRFLVGLREHKVLSAETLAIMRKDNMGWDFSDPGWTKGGLWVWDEGTRAGQFGSVISQFPDGIDAVLLVNCLPPVNFEELVVQAWRESGE